MGTKPSTQKPCPKGTYSPALGLKSEEECWICPGGSVCEPETGGNQPLAGATTTEKLCQAGFYCEPYAPVTTAKQCTAGSVCPPGSAFPQPCPPGTLQQESECVPCPPGQACYLYGQIKAKYKQCLAGHFCEGGADTPIYKVARSGTYTEPGADKVELCPVGTYNSFAGQSEVKYVDTGFDIVVSMFAGRYFNRSRTIASANITLSQTYANLAFTFSVF